jgi:hypothetical protein
MMAVKGDPEWFVWSILCGPTNEKKKLFLSCQMVAARGRRGPIEKKAKKGAITRLVSNTTKKGGETEILEIKHRRAIVFKKLLKVNKTCLCESL